MGMVVAVLAASPGCMGARHMAPDFGRATGAWVAAQRPPGGGTAQAVSGLDSQESTIVARAYRRSLDPKAEKGSQRQEPEILMLEKTERGRTEARPLAPSVPKE